MLETSQTKDTRSGWTETLATSSKKDSPILSAMRTCFQRVCEQHSWNGAIDLTKERGENNLHVQVAGGDGNIGQAVGVSPNEMEVDESGHRASEGLRPVNP